MVANSSVDTKHHLSGASSSESSDSAQLQHWAVPKPKQRSESSESAQLQHRVVPKPKQRPASTPCKYLTHFPTFNCKEDCRIITDTAAQLELSGFYWGPLGVEEAHRMLKDAPPGSYLIRDSRQKDVFFTLSYHAKSGPVSVRIDYKRQKFSLVGNERTFPSLFALLEHYSNSPKRSLRVPYRKWEPTLQELCRRRIMELCGGGRQISELPLTNVAQGFLLEFPYKL